ncbi:hypothetical protein EYF80_011113 [Liparis tanakae]|uniref:Uncharacterized protein n=1 Tax=Liparis tanakae TaxID=230148 RepID=A0A4Z2IL12_9TELE|nr:hypothetical protein EYF80_011113 [Liparis tanakae]
MNASLSQNRLQHILRCLQGGLMRLAVEKAPCKREGCDTPSRDRFGIGAIRELEGRRRFCPGIEERMERKERRKRKERGMGKQRIRSKLDHELERAIPSALWAQEGHGGHNNDERPEDERRRSVEMSGGGADCTVSEGMVVHITPNSTKQHTQQQFKEQRAQLPHRGGAGRVSPR